MHRIATLSLWLVLGTAWAAPEFPALTGRVVDQADLLTAAQEQTLSAELAGLETKTGAQLVVVTLRDLQGVTIEEYGVELGRRWGIGRQGEDDGALLIVAPTERAVRIEVGYGLEGTLTDATSRLIIENAILPHFRAGRLAEGVLEGARAIVRVVGGEVDPAQLRRRDEAPRSGDFGGAVFFILFLLFWLRGLGRRRRRGPFVFGGPMVLGGGRRGGSGGGFSGGGGSFGGGGASGRW